MTKKFVIFIFSLALAIGLVSTRPLVINADALSIYYDTDALRTEWQGKILGDYWQYTSSDNASTSLQPVYNYKFRFDKAYIGQIQFYVRFSGQSNWSASSERVLVAGMESFDWYYKTLTVNNTNTYIDAIKISSVNLTPLDDYGGDLASIISYLQSINATEDDIYTVLQSVSSDTEMIKKIRSYDIPFESLLLLTYFNSYHDPEDTYMSGVYDFKFPVYKMNGRSFRLYGYKDHQYKMIVMSKSSTINHFNQNFSISPNTGISLTAVNYSGYTYFFRQSYLYLMTYTFTCTATNNYYFDYVGTDQSYYVVPIYYGDVNNKNISTDFALKFGLSNQLLDDLHIIAQGTQQSNSSSSNLENSSSDFSTSANTMFGYEETFNNNLNDSLDNINPNFSFDNSFGSKFLRSADFVKDQFDLLTQNNAFGSLLAFSLLLGLGLLILGKIL